MEGWQEICRVSHTAPVATEIGQLTDTLPLTFDLAEDLVWAGDTNGIVSSYYGETMQPYSRFRAGRGRVTSLVSHDRGLVALTTDALHYSTRGGITRKHVTDPSLGNNLSMTFTHGPTEFVVGGNSDKLVVINSERGDVTRVVDAPGVATHMGGSSSCVVWGTDTGKLVVGDNNLKELHTFQAHQGPFSDVSVQDNVVMTCGFSAASTGHRIDPLIKVWDLRMMRAMAPISYPLAAFVCQTPDSRTLITSPSGQLEFLDHATQQIKLYQAEVALVNGVKLSPRGHHFVVADTSGQLQLWSDEPQSSFAEFSAPTAFPTPEQSYPPVSIRDTRYPLGAVGMPYYSDTLLSAMPSSIINVGMPPEEVDEDLEVRQIDFVGHAPNHKQQKRNLAQKYSNQRRTSIAAPKFLSEKEKERARRMEDIEDESFFGDEDTCTELSMSSKKVPRLYRKLEIKYSKFGISDFDFSYYNNHTGLSGLETNPFNPLLQLFRFCSPVFNFALRSVARGTPNRLLNEVGLLFDMMHKARGHVCRASNLMHCYDGIAQTRSLAPEDASNIVLFCRFLLEQIGFEQRQTPALFDSFRQLLGATVMTVNTFSCGKVAQAESVWYTLELAPGSTFYESLERTLDKELQTRAWCDKCRKYQSLHVSKHVESLPQVLTLSVADGNVDVAPSFLVLDGKVSPASETDNDAYKLVGFICQIQGNGHVAFIRVENEWYLFNDFLVTKVSEKEAFMRTPWKRTVMMVYAVGADERFDYDSWKNDMDLSALFQERLVNGNNVSRETTDYGYELIKEVPPPKTLCAIDAEFVVLKNEETEIRSDGTKVVLAPRNLCLARVTLLNEDGDPFINDYIAINEHIVDYLTTYSGIEPGDLDPSISRKPLVSLPTSYRRLWLLLNLGCVFVGHGLANDFRTINMQVPPEQVIDTLDLYYIPSERRKLSLRFLAWCVLGKKVQSGNHDSTEDSHTALLLYKRYQECAPEEFQVLLLDVYRQGRMCNFKVPDA
ncbi:PAB-dependent poly(A)-specific ribonuclease subunit PAN2 [Yarrowia sp. C11]|nr:PAB-dependent poly(A)-specific ribonuclease subunit PAN2 [Yarrowia sp. C11]KAG5371014.1 PAB-dependent poly(A)-specific ribonuclease subunit PAN2 [Yarrowia sp. E02]